MNEGTNLLLSDQKKLDLGVSFVFIVLGAGSYFLRTHYFSKEQQISHFIEAIENGDAKN